MICENCGKDMLIKVCHQRRNCTRIEYKCSCGFVDFDFTDIVSGWMGKENASTIDKTSFTPATSLRKAHP